MDWQGFYEKFKDSSLKKRGVQVAEFVQERAEYEEDHHVELKQCNYASGKVTKDTKGDLAQEASAFANAAGGLIIWGFDGNRCPVRISDAKGAADKLHSLGGECTRPAIDGIETIPALTKGTEKEGYAVTYIPHSQTAPHQAAMGGPKINGKYFRRRGNRSPHMEHAELDDMFGRRPRPDLVPGIQLMNGSGELRCIRCHVGNRGPGTAFGVTVEVSLPLIYGRDDELAAMGPKYCIEARRSSPTDPVPACSNDPPRADTYIPLNGRPIRSEGGTRHAMDVWFSYENCFSHCESKPGRLLIKVTLGAHNMRPGPAPSSCL